jgi:hypothetical protein
MKMNKWTLGLAAVGLVSLTPALRAADAMPVPQPVMTALSATTISGYVDTSAVWNPGTGNANPAPYSFNKGMQDGFNLDAVDLKIAKKLDESSWAAGYTLELMGGPAAVYGPYKGLRQAYVEMRANVGNGLDFKFGQWDNLLGYEGHDAMNDPNWTRSYGYTIEPSEHVGLLAAYPFSSSVNLQVGIANELNASQNRNVSGMPAPGGFDPNGKTIESKKALVSLLTLTAPDSWGALKGSALYAGLDYGPGDAFSHAAPDSATAAGDAHVVDKTEIYVGATIMTPVKGLSVGASWDTINNSDIGTMYGSTNVEGYASSMALYLSYHVPDTKLTLNTRAEYAHGSAFDYLDPLYVNEVNHSVKPTIQEAKLLGLTETVEYKLWGDNVISRLEGRWDMSADGSPHFGSNDKNGNPTRNNQLMIAANVIYKF